jgi:hypothetical protein
MKKSALAEQLRVHFLGLGYSPNEMLDCSDDEIIGAIEDREVTKAVTVGDSAVRVLADGSEITGLLGGMRSWRWSGSRLR